MNFLDCKICRINASKDYHKRNKPAFKLCKHCEAEIDQMRTQGQIVEEFTTDDVKENRFTAQIVKYLDGQFGVTILENVNLNGKFSSLKEAKDAIEVYRKTPVFF